MDKNRRLKFILFGVAITGFTISVGCLGTVVVHVARTAHWYTVGMERSLEEKREWLTHEADHVAIQRACAHVMANPHHYPQPPGHSFASGLPPELTALDADSMWHDGSQVAFMFGRDYALVVTDTTAAAPPTILPYTKLAPGVWLVEYSGH